MNVIQKIVRKKGGEILQEVSFINSRNEKITFTNNAPYVFWKIDGLSLQDVQAIYTQAPNQHGYTLNNLLLSERTINLYCHIHHSHIFE